MASARKSSASFCRDLAPKRGILIADAAGALGVDAAAAAVARRLLESEGQPARQDGDGAGARTVGGVASIGCTGASSPALDLASMASDARLFAAPAHAHAVPGCADQIIRHCPKLALLTFRGEEMEMHACVLEPKLVNY